jgi:hypothetical protein
LSLELLQSIENIRDLENVCNMRRIEIIDKLTSVHD